MRLVAGDEDHLVTVGKRPQQILGPLAPLGIDIYERIVEHDEPPIRPQVNLCEREPQHERERGNGSLREIVGGRRDRPASHLRRQVGIELQGFGAALEVVRLDSCTRENDGRSSREGWWAL